MKNETNETRESIALSNATTSWLLLLVVGCPPLFLQMLEGEWLYGARLAVALLFGILSIVYAKKADKKAIEGMKEKAVKFAKEARAGNIIQIIYGVFSWFSIIN